MEELGMAKKSKEKLELAQTKNKFKVVGVVSRIDQDYAYKEDEVQSGKNEGKTFRSLRFGVKTSDTNEITVSMYSVEPEKVFLWNSEMKKEDNDYKGTWVEYEDWEENQEQYREDGYAVLQTRVGLSYGEDGKIESKGLPSYVAIEEIYEGLNNGDSVVVEGTIGYNTYENRDKKVVESKNFNIEKVFKIKDVDFESEKFEEVTYYEQEIVFVDSVAEKKESKVYVTGRHINYNKSFHDTQFVIDYSDGEGGTNPDMVKLAEAFVKKVKFGDVLNIFGDVLNRVIIEEVEDDEDEDDDNLAMLGGKSKPKHAQTYASRSYVSESQIHGVDAWDKKVYAETDFEVEKLVEEDKKDKKKKGKNKISDEFGGKGKKNDNPFDTEDVEDLDLDDEDLPF